MKRRNFLVHCRSFSRGIVAVYTTVYTTFIQRYTNDYRTLLYVPDDNRGFASRSPSADATGASLSAGGAHRAAIGERQPRCMHSAGTTVTLRKKVRVRKHTGGERDRERERADRVSPRNCSHVHYETRAFPRCCIVRRDAPIPR